MAIATINPFNGETLREFAELTPEQLNAKLELSATAFSRYRTTTFSARAKCNRFYLVFLVSHTLDPRAARLPAKMLH